MIKFDREKANALKDLKLALAKEQHLRTSEFGRLCNLGHVRVVEDNNPALITVAIEDERFSDERAKFPSVRLMARLQLAIAAGRSENNGSVLKLDDLLKAKDTISSYGWPGGGMHYESNAYIEAPAVWDRWEAISQGYANASAKLPPAVKPPKGPRP